MEIAHAVMRKGSIEEGMQEEGSQGEIDRRGRVDGRMAWESSSTLTMIGANGVWAQRGPSPQDSLEWAFQPPSGRRAVGKVDLVVVEGKSEAGGELHNGTSSSILAQRQRTGTRSGPRMADNSAGGGFEVAEALGWMGATGSAA